MDNAQKNKDSDVSENSSLTPKDPANDEGNPLMPMFIIFGLLVVIIVAFLVFDQG